MLAPKTLLMIILSAVGGFLGSLGDRLLPVEGLVGQALMDCCGLTVSTRQVRLKWPLGLEATGLSLRDKQGRPVLTARRLSLTAHARDLLLAPRRLDRLDMQGVDVYLRRDKKGQWNIAGLLGKQNGGDPAVGLRQASLKNLTLHVEDHTQTPPLKLTEQADTLWADLSAPTSRLPVRASRRGKHSYALSAVLTPRGGWSASRFDFSLKNYPVAEAVKLVPLGWLTPLPPWALPTAGVMDGSLKSSGGGLNGRFTLRGVRRGLSQPLGATAEFAVSPRAVTVKQLLARTGQGQARLAFSCVRPAVAMGPKAPPSPATAPCIRGRAQLWMNRFALQSVAAFLPWPFARDLRGNLSGEVHAGGNPADLPGLTGGGEVTLTDGQMLGLNNGGGPAHIRQARASGELADGSLALKRLLLDSDQIGLDMSGRVGLDGALDLAGKARLPKKDVLGGIKVLLAPLLKDKKDQVEFRVRVGGTVAAPELSGDALKTIAQGVQDNLKDVGNETETAGRRLGNTVEDATRHTANRIEKALKKLF